MLQINVKGEYRRDNQKWTIQRIWQHMVHKMKKNTTHLCWTPLCANNVSKTWALLQTEVKKNRTTFLCGNRNGHGAQNVKTHNSATQKKL